MKHLILITLFVLSSLTIKSQELIVNGYFSGRNLIVQNPFGSSGIGFCVYEILVNGKTTLDEINSSTFEIDFSNLSVTEGDKLNVVIKHKEGCTPKILNADVLKPRSTFEIVSIEYDKEKKSIVWITKSESGPLPYKLQQFKWNKWLTIGKIRGKGNSTKNEYSLPVELHSGVNRFRIMQIDYTNTVNISDELIVRSLQMPVEYNLQKNKKIIVFNQETNYEIYNTYGRKILNNYGDTIDISGFDKGKYFMNFDNKTEEFKY